jgi:hypothetical protein
MFMRQCVGCGRRKRKKDFSFKCRKSGRLQARCKSCTSSYSRDHYKKNREKYYARNVQYKQGLETEASLVLRWLKQAPCLDCGGFYPPFVMDFDHVRGEKKFGISRYKSRGVPLPALLDEILKCELVCANCHRIRTCNRLGEIG